MTCSFTTYDRHFRMDLPCGMDVTATREGVAWCAQHDPMGEYQRQRAAYHRACAEKSKATANSQIRAPTVLTLRSVQRRLRAALGDQVTIVSTPPNRWREEDR